MICFLLGWPCWILTNCKSSPKFPAGQLSQVSSVISREPKTIKKPCTIHDCKVVTLATGLYGTVFYYGFNRPYSRCQSLKPSLVFLNRASFGRRRNNDLTSQEREVTMMLRHNLRTDAQICCKSASISFCPSWPRRE